jgi:hypothetical protein
MKIRYRYSWSLDLWILAEFFTDYRRHPSNDLLYEYNNRPRFQR